jgi:ornithine--oxo-acid transaminase
MKLKEPGESSSNIVCENNPRKNYYYCSFSNDENARKSFGPFTAGFIKIPYDDTDALETALKSTTNIAGFLVEPIQGEAEFMFQVKVIWPKPKHFAKRTMFYL